MFAVSIPEERGSFKRFCKLVGNRSVTDLTTASRFVGRARVRWDRHRECGRQSTLAAFRRHGYATVDLSHDELAAEHVRYMVGGKSAWPQAN